MTTTERQEAIAEARRAAQEAVLRERVRRGEVSLACACCGDACGSDWVDVDGDWTCGRCAARVLPTIGTQLAGVAVLALLATY